MEPNQTQDMGLRSKVSAKDFFLQVGSMVALYTVAYNIINLLFTIIEKAYPRINSGYSYYYNSSYSISFPVATLVIMFPVFILLMWLLEKSYVSDPQKQHSSLKKWLTYITLFLSGAAVVGDLITLVYYFIDGQELTTGFLLKVLSVFAIALGIFFYYITDVRDMLTHQRRIIWRIVAFVVVIGVIVLGFSVMGSPRSQQLLKYDQQKISDLNNFNSSVTSYYSSYGELPKTINDLNNTSYYYIRNDSQTGKPYEYEKLTDGTYNVCAEFNKTSTENNTYGGATAPMYYDQYNRNPDWTHPAGRYCFTRKIDLSLKPLVPLIKN